MTAPWARSADIVQSLDQDSPLFFFRYLLQPERRFEYVGPGVTRIKGYTPDEHYANPDLPFKIVLDEDRPALEALLRNPIEEPVPATLRWWRKDGNIAKTRAWIFPVTDAGRSTVAIEGVVCDVTGWEHGTALHDPNTLLNALGEAVLVMTKDGTVVFANPAADALFGAGSGQLLGSSALDLWAPEARALAVEAHAQNLAGRPWSGRVTCRRRDGSMFLAHAAITPVRSGTGEVVGKIAITSEFVTREAIEEAVSRERSRLERLLARCPAVVYTAHAQPPFGTTYISDNIRRQLGYEPVDFTSDPGFWVGRIHPDDREKVLAALPRLFSDDALEHEYRFRHADGSYRWMHDENRLVRGEDGTPIEMVGYWIDITARKSAEQELERFFTLSLDLLGIAGFDGTFKRLNPAWRDTLGWDLDELLGKPFIDFVHPDDRERTIQEGSRIVQEGVGSAAFENRYRCKDGSYRWFLWKSTPVPDAGVHYFTAREITDRKRQEEELRRAREGAEEQVRQRTAELETTNRRLAAELELRERAEESLQRSERQYRDVFEYAPLGICQTTPGGAFLSVNATLSGMLGYASPGELMRYPVETLYADAADRRTVVERLETDGIVANRELRWRRKDGGVAWIQLDAVAVRDEEGKVRYFQAFVRDITERKALQEQLVQAQKMEAVGRLAGGIAHDFNNLLTAIKGNADLALMDLPAAAPLRSDLEEIQAAAERAARLTRQLLMFSRKQVAEVEPLDLNQLLQDLEKMLRRILGEDVDLHLRTASDIGLVEADRGQMEQVVMNLVINARDAMPKGGKLTIETTQVELDADYARLHAEVTPGPHVVLSVSDTGQGMDAETQRHIFEPFFTTKPEGRGTGLGLATVYGVVKQCRGHIWVYSEPERGTVFKIYLPVSAALAREPARPSLGAAVPGGTETIVLVEDEAGVRDLAVRVLERFGYSVITTHSPLEALEVLRTHGGPLDLILTDVVMPKMSGPELIEQVRSIRPDIKVLFMSGYTDETVMRHGILAAGVPFLQKPFSSTQLATKVREVLDG